VRRSLVSFCSLVPLHTSPSPSKVTPDVRTKRQIEHNVIHLGNT